MPVIGVGSEWHSELRESIVQLGIDNEQKGCPRNSGTAIVMIYLDTHCVIYLGRDLPEKSDKDRS